MTWRKIDLDALPPAGARMRLVQGAGMFTGFEAQFLCLATGIRKRQDKTPLEGPWVIGYRNGGGTPLIYRPTAWEWLDETKDGETKARTIGEQLKDAARGRDDGGVNEDEAQDIMNEALQSKVR